MKNLYIDFDGVLVDTITTTYRLLEKHEIDVKNLKEVREFYRTLDWGKIIEISTIINHNLNLLKTVMWRF